MVIDTSGFSGESTRKGGVRNSREFWRAWEDRYADPLSPTNRQRIDSGRSPVVDDRWIETFGEHEQYKTETLIHHHIDCGALAMPLPDAVHRYQPGQGALHQNC